MESVKTVNNNNNNNTTGLHLTDQGKRLGDGHTKAMSWGAGGDAWLQMLAGNSVI